MISSLTKKLNRGLFFILFQVFSTAAFSQLPEVKVDFNMNGRPATEVEEPGYFPWVLKSSLLDSITVNGLRIQVKKGPRGVSISPTYFKASVQAGAFNAKFTNDGIFVKDGDFAAGSQIDLIFKNLPPGEHSLITYHNVTDNLTSGAVCPIDVYVNNVLVIDNLVPTVRLEKITDCASSEVLLKVEGPAEMVVSFRAETSGSQAVKNVYVNGFQLNGVNAGKKSRSPKPAHGEEHLDVPIGGTYELQWEKSPTAISHDVYFGTDSVSVANADRTSANFKGNQPLQDTTYTASNLYTMDKYYWRVDEVSSASTSKGSVWHFRTRQLAFPDAEGYGRFARGGRGGKVVEVTNLNDSGAGSFREAVENNIGPRTIVFSVSGIIELQSRLVLKDPYVTVAGQTAPGKGICIRSAPFGITGNDCIVRHMRVRLGAGKTYDGMGLTGANHSIMDHCSISWTIDEAFSSRGAKNITLQRTLISEALNDAGHQNYPAGTKHGYAATIGGDKGSFHHNLLAHCEGRNWSMGGGLDGNGFYSGELDITNNVVYNWGGRSTDGGAKEVNFVNNYYKPGPATRHFYAFTLNHEGVGKGMQRAYFSGNVMPGRFNESSQTLGRRAVYSNGDTSSYQTFLDQPFFPSYVATQSAYQAYKNVLSDVGCTQPMFDNHDIRIVKETLDSSYTYVGSKTSLKGLPDHQDDVGGYEDYPEVRRASDWDSDHDGMPDWWEKLKGFSPNSPAGDFSDSNADPDRDGNTPLEEYLEWMSNPHYNTKGTDSLSIDLRTLTRGYKAAPKFTVSNSGNGSISVSDSIAVFKPSKLGVGFFYFTVTDSEGASLTRKVNILSLEPGVTSPAPQTQTITFNALAAKTTGDADFDAGATASSGLAVTLSSSNTAVATIVAGKIHIVGAGTTTITASQAGDANWLAAVPVSRELVVAKQAQTITFNTFPSKSIASDDFMAGATASSGLTVSYISSNTAVATVVNGTIQITGIGSTDITASQAGNAQYNAATPVMRTLVISDRFKLPANNFQVKAADEVCSSENNGKITISAAQNMRYKATVAINGTNSVLPFTSTLEIPSLNAGSYKVCITVDEQPDFSQCFDLTVREPQALSMYSVVKSEDKTVVLNLAGSQQYFIQMNDNTYQTTSSSITLPLADGLNKISISTEKQCQGTIERSIFVSNGLSIYPNPFDQHVFINMGNDNSASANVTLTDLSGARRYAGMQQVQDGVVQVNFSDLPQGMYIINVKTNLTESSSKILKK